MRIENDTRTTVNVRQMEPLSNERIRDFRSSIRLFRGALFFTDHYIFLSGPSQKPLRLRVGKSNAARLRIS